MLRSAVLSSVGLLALASSAFAADLPSRRAAPPPYVAVPLFTWTGFYIGGNAGYVFNNDPTITTQGNNGTAAGPGTLFNTLSNIRVNSVRLESEGFTGGGQVGYNYQIGSFVVGLEADASYTDLKKSGTFFGTTPAAAGLAASTFRSDLSYLGTVRGRLGYAFDRTLIYGTGGLAYGDVKTSQIFYAPGTGTGVVQFTGRRSGVETGWVAGGGVEYAIPTSTFAVFNNAVTLKAEGLYYDLGRQNSVVSGVVAAPIPGSGITTGTSYTSRYETSGVIARAGINFKFGS